MTRARDLFEIVGPQTWRTRPRLWWLCKRVDARVCWMMWPVRRARLRCALTFWALGLRLRLGRVLGPQFQAWQVKRTVRKMQADLERRP